MTRAEILDETYNTTQQRLREEREDASPWPDDVAMGLDDGAGYNFSRKTLRAFIKSIFAGLKTTARLKPVADKFNMPGDIDLDTLLSHDVLYLERWIAGSVADQVGV